MLPAVPPSLDAPVEDYVAEFGSTVIPLALLERAASHARIRSAFDFMARSGAVHGNDGDGPESVELTDAAVELIDDILGRMVEDAAEQASALALLRQQSAASNTVQAATFPRTAAAARDVLAMRVPVAHGAAATITPADVELYLADVWRHVQLPSTNPARHLPLDSTAASHDGAAAKRARPQPAAASGR